ncbi:hypothetical protein [Ramlibacter humi]|uniref:Uncharacterized protein n=1 Tax=Ramlibacter humi TaxID=2530451 RepID=A0A4Z0BLD0_9BURK|nr:hypothetical protein [Ramlibacter humi]TFY99067.1 hypothetical protein EZ216_16030 [Ramlibacter humi]
MSVPVSVLLIASLVLGVSYTALGWSARKHLREGTSEADRSIGWLFWWSFAKEKYDDEGKRVCDKGQLLAFGLVALYAAWYFVLLRK